MSINLNTFGLGGLPHQFELLKCLEKFERKALVNEKMKERGVVELQSF